MLIGGSDNKWLQRFLSDHLHQLNNQLSRRLRSRLRKEGINISRWRVLMVLQVYRKLDAVDIADLTVMEQPSVRRILVQLEQKGLVKRNIQQEGAHFVLTAAGEKAFKHIYSAAIGYQELALRGFSRAEGDAFIGFLQRIRANIESEGT